MSSIFSPADLQNAATRVAQSLNAKPVASVHSMTSTGSGTAAADGSGAISSNDFLTLLVTEMKNQDPTQPTDPNAYIQQLVGVNSLQQLIAINKDLSSAADGSSSSTTPINSITAQ